MIGLLLKAAALCSALTSREVPADRACAAALPLVMQEGYPAELLAAIAVGESRLVADATNTRTGCWGVMQTCGRRPRAVTTWASVAAAVRALDDARWYCERRDHGRGDWTVRECELAGYQSGPTGVDALVAGERWPRVRARRVLRRAARIAARVQRWQTVEPMRAPRAAGCLIVAVGVAGVSTC